MSQRLKEPEFVVVATVIMLTFIIDMIAFFSRVQYLEHDMKVMILSVWNGQALLTAIGYAIGTSASSKAKDNTIAAVLKKDNSEKPGAAISTGS